MITMMACQHLPQYLAVVSVPGHAAYQLMYVGYKAEFDLDSCEVKPQQRSRTEGLQSDLDC